MKESNFVVVLINLYREQFILCSRLNGIPCRFRDVLVCV